MKTSATGHIKKLVLVLFLAAGFFAVISAQSFIRLKWEKSYDINLADEIQSIIKTADGNYILAGETTTPAGPEHKILILKITPSGDVIWQKAFGGSSDYRYTAIAESSTDGFYVLGKKHQGTSNNLVLVLKINNDGNLDWETVEGGGETEFMADISENQEGGVFICGSKKIKGNPDSDGWLIKINKKGKSESQAMIGLKYIDEAFSSIVPDNYGGFLLAGFTSEKMGDEKIPYVVRIDSRGTKTWEKSFPSFAGSMPSDLYFNQDGLVSCLMNTYSEDGKFSKITKLVIDPNGNVVNSYSIASELNISKNSYVVTDNDKLILLSVQDNDPSVFSDKFIIKLDKAMNPVLISPLDIENISLKAIHSLDNSVYLAAGCYGLNNYKLDIKAIGFLDYSDNLIKTYVDQKLYATAGMNVNENVNDFKLRIGSAAYNKYVNSFEADAVKDLKLVPESYLSSSDRSGSDSRVSIISSTKENAATATNIGLEGKYYALLIAIEDYKDPMINDLDKPVKDAKKLYDVLVSQYLFEKNDVIFLENPSREEIISTLDKLEKQITQSDNLLIFYAGHGYWNKTSEKGYWLPADASKENTANWIGNSTISDYIRTIPAKHTLLIADACFSGSIFKTRAAFSGQDMSAMKLNELVSRKAMTSGTLTEVPDKSFFIDYLVKRLYENPDQFLGSEQLFFSFKTAVLNNTQSIPQFGVVQNAGDEGGDFIFVKRKK